MSAEGFYLLLYSIDFAKLETSLLSLIHSKHQHVSIEINIVQYYLLTNYMTTTCINLISEY